MKKEETKTPSKTDQTIRQHKRMAMGDKIDGQTPVDKSQKTSK